MWGLYSAVDLEHAESRKYWDKPRSSWRTTISAVVKVVPFTSFSSFHTVREKSERKPQVNFGIASKLHSNYNGWLCHPNFELLSNISLWHLLDCRNPVYFGHSLFLRTICLKTSTSKAQGLADSKHRLMFKSTMYIPSLSKS